MLKNISTKKWHSWVAAIFSASAIWGTSLVVMAEKEEVSDSDAIPTVITQPRYPRKAAEEGIEGWVKFKFKFNIDSNGHPYDVMLIDAQPRNVFERDAKKVIYQWLFEKNKSQKNMIYTMNFILAEPDSEE